MRRRKRKRQRRKSRRSPLEAVGRVFLALKWQKHMSIRGFTHVFHYKRSKS